MLVGDSLTKGFCDIGGLGPAEGLELSFLLADELGLELGLLDGFELGLERGL